ncbi:MAG: DNA polymerase I [Candidatus Paraimprobicoccus trichonymphae]|uniref:DNA polymerase I n=1 Tax=Candidatus Paraimprobicoccus trichonymphae TaxID=3033793 RepID=A0AA48I434_9FIRM|nr:MAG: DNA polymerase I [Candidatus Paraimprobicoccus trichonymphae]
MKKLLIIDSNSIFVRAFYGIKMLSTKSGIFTNAIYGFLKTLKKLRSDINPDIIIFAFDLPDKTFRHEIFKNYKAQRTGMPNELAKQLPVLKEIINFFGYKIVTYSGYEADDILGTFANLCKKNLEYYCILASGDTDMLQLVSKKTQVVIYKFKFGKTEVINYNEKKIIEDFGLKPKNLIDVKSLQGDISDNIPGVSGIGQKTALKLIQKFENIENIYENIDNLNISKNIKNKLILGKDLAFISKKLGRICVDVPIDSNFENYIQSKPDLEKIGKIFEKFEFFSFIKEMNLDDSNENICDFELKYVEKLDILLENIKSKINFYFLVNYKENDIEKISVLVDKKVFIIKSSCENFYEFLKKLLEDENVSKFTYDIKRLKNVLNSRKIYIKNIRCDIMLACYILNPSFSNYELEKIFERYGILPKCSNFICYLEKLVNLIFEDLNKNDQLKLLEIEQKFALALSDMENLGFEIDKIKLEKYSEKLNKILENLVSKIYDFIGIKFNINSPKQLSNILFEKLKLPKNKKNKSNYYSTNSEILKNLIEIHPIINLILEYKTISKLKSTYCNGILKFLKPDNRIYTIFNQTETKTGRISSLEPNLQNIPIKSEIGRELRSFFIAKKDFLLIDADYSQIELRILAHLSQDEKMLNLFKENKDIHKITASKIFNIDVNLVTKEMRSRAKTVNFAVIYGMSAYSLSQELKITLKEASEYIINYFNFYKDICKYFEKTINFAKKNNFVETLFKRRRYVPEIKSSNFNMRTFGERIIKNMPIQGTSADIIKIAMININKKLKKFKSKIILQVHDEIILESPIEEIEVVKELVNFEMENAVNLSVPLMVNISVGENWGNYI